MVEQLISKSFTLSEMFYTSHHDALSPVLSEVSECHQGQSNMLNNRPDILFAVRFCFRTLLHPCKNGGPYITLAGEILRPKAGPVAAAPLQRDQQIQPA